MLRCLCWTRHSPVLGLLQGPVGAAPGSTIPSFSTPEVGNTLCPPAKGQEGLTSTSTCRGALALDEVSREAKDLTTEMGQNLYEALNFKQRPQVHAWGTGGRQTLDSRALASDPGQWTHHAQTPRVGRDNRHARSG